MGIGINYLNNTIVLRPPKEQRNPLQEQREEKKERSGFSIKTVRGSLLELCEAVIWISQEVGGPAGGRGGRGGGWGG